MQKAHKAPRGPRRFGDERSVSDIMHRIRWETWAAAEQRRLGHEAHAVGHDLARAGYEKALERRRPPPPDADGMDRHPRYAPSHVNRGNLGDMPVLRYVAHPPGQHPPACPLIPDCVALELVTAAGSRWWGFEDAYINAELRMVVVGFPARCEIRRCWEQVPTH